MPDVILPPPFQAYTGKEPYVFVSYAHMDGTSVFPDIARFMKLAIGYGMTKESTRAMNGPR